VPDQLADRELGGPRVHTHTVSFAI
jgi:hypothetical protein